MKLLIVAFHDPPPPGGFFKAEQYKKSRETLLECCSILEDSLSESIGRGASGTKRMLTNQNFILKFLNKLMPHVDIVFNQLKSKATMLLRLVLI